MTMAYYLLNHGVLSLHGVLPSHGALPSDLSGERPPAPTAYREPVYPVFAALGLALTNEANNLELSKFHNQPLNRLKKLYYLLILGTGLVAGFIVWVITKNVPVSYLTMAAVTLPQTLTRSVDGLMSEPLIAFLVTLLSLSLLLVVKNKKGWCFVLAGVVLGLLTLTRATFYYFWPVILIFFLYAWRMGTFEKRHVLRGTVLFFLSFFLIVGAWMGRNYYHFDRAFIAERGGGALSVRAQYNMMSFREYLASFVYWSGCDGIRSLTERLHPDDFRRLDKSQADSYYRTARKRGVELREQYMNRAKADEVRRNEALANIMKHPFRHVMATLTFAHRGMYVQRCPIGLFLFLSTFALLVWSMFRRDIRIIALLLPALYSFAFFSFLTSSISRYNVPLIPVLWVGTILLFYFMYLVIRSRYLDEGSLRRAQPIHIRGTKVDSKQAH